ncbi:unnamed protein product [Cyprideis torosa]|uniref:Uncharacterized protein n=1 Tax=Cyprideis torosa TaxID=163714 RepID=A0A7R8ZJB1_9CRUS|nr:unnamed protein product [Cyprideis torosa]CAG0886494.1 unnamed protein product [Cyprideis torosa]
MAPVKIYRDILTPSCRAVMLTAANVGIEVESIPINPMEGETRTPEFLKMNPCHTIPTMDDNGLYLSESRAILGYLVNRYGKNDSLYPQDPVPRAMVDNYLYFDMGLWSKTYDFFAPVAFKSEKLSFATKREKSFDEGAKRAVEEGLGHLEIFLTTGGPWVAGDHMTIADFTLIATVSSIMAIGQFTTDKHPKIQEWMYRCKVEMKDYDEYNGKPCEVFSQFIGGKIIQNLQQ